MIQFLGNFLHSWLSHPLLAVVSMTFLWVASILVIARKQLHCSDLLVGPDGKLSVEAIGQLFGIFVAVWSPVHSALSDHLDPMVLSVALAYLGGIHAYQKWINSRNGGNDHDEKP